MKSLHVWLLGCFAATSLAGLGVGCGDDGGETSGTPAPDSSSSSSSSSSSAGTGGAGGGGSSQSSNGGGNAGGGGGGDEGWACLGNVTWPTASTETITVDFTLTGFGSSSALAGLTVKACDRTDTDCANPIATATTDNAGAASLKLPVTSAGFEGYAELSGTGIPTSLVFVYPPLVADQEYSLSMLTTVQLEGFAQILQKPFDPAKGSIAGIAQDCEGDPAAGLTVTASPPGETQVYVNNNLPSPGATETDDTGVAGILNVAPGEVTLTTKLASGTMTGTVKVFTRAGALTYTTLPPTP